MPNRPLLPLVLAAMVALAAGPAWGQVSGTPVAPGPVLIVPGLPSPLEVAAPLPEGFQFRQTRAWQLVEIGGAGAVVGAQVVPAPAPDGSPLPEAGVLVAAIPGQTGPGGPRRFHLEAVKTSGDDAPEAIGPFRFKDASDKSLGLWEGDKPVLVYNHGVITREDIPEKEHRRSRSCYVHPVYGLSGEVLTDDFPKDHYHHHGIFWTWPHIQIDGREHDLWAGNTIRQKFERWLARSTGPAAAVLGVENGWHVGDKKVMTERVWLRAYKAAEGSERAIDIDLTITPADRPVTLWGAPGKSYGGLTVRFAPGARRDTLITVPSGPTKDDLPDTRLEWADFTSQFQGPQGRSGAAVMVHPGHPDFPPTWLTRYYGPLCVGWPGVKPKTLEPGKPVRLSYRFWIHKDAADPGALKAAYVAYRLAAQGVRWGKAE